MSVVFHGTYRHLGSFDSNGTQVAASGSVAVTPSGGSTVTSTLDAAGTYEATLPTFTGWVSVVETLTGAAQSPRTKTYLVLNGERVDTSWEFYIGGAYSPELALIDGGTP